MVEEKKREGRKIKWCRRSRGREGKLDGGGEVEVGEEN